MFGDKISQEAWSKYKWTAKNVIYLSVWYMHMCQRRSRQKLDEKGEKYIFMGYSVNSKAYRLYNPITKKIIISGDVEFIENKSWDRSVYTSPSTSHRVPVDDEYDEYENQQDVAIADIKSQSQRIGSREL